MKKVTVQLVDDLDGEPIVEGDGGTIAFSIDGKSLEIDLRSANILRLRELLAPYVAAGRPVAGSRTRSASRKDTESSQDELRLIRDWARESGLQVSDRGRIAASVREAYVAAH